MLLSFSFVLSVSPEGFVVVSAGFVLGGVGRAVGLAVILGDVGMGVIFGV